MCLEILSVGTVIHTVDIHTHILPFVDDGADDLGEALEMLEIAERNGTSSIILTPHYLTKDGRSKDLQKSQLEEKFEEFRQLAIQNNLKINMHFGAEVYSSDDIDSKIERDQIITLNNTRYVLVEFDFNEEPDRALQIAEKFIGAGYTPIIAHPERYRFVKSDPSLIVPFAKKGVLFQLNSSSILGENGPASEETAFALIHSGLASVVASDSHSAFYRSPDLSEAYTLVSSLFSKEFSELLFFENPRLILEGKPIKTIS